MTKLSLGDFTVLNAGVGKVGDRMKTWWNAARGLVIIAVTILLVTAERLAAVAKAREHQSRRGRWPI